MRRMKNRRLRKGERKSVLNHRIKLLRPLSSQNTIEPREPLLRSLVFPSHPRPTQGAAYIAEVTLLLCTVQRTHGI